MDNNQSDIPQSDAGLFSEARIVAALRRQLRDHLPPLAPAPLDSMTNRACLGLFFPTTPSTPLNDAHQEGYSFIEVASRLIRTQRSAMAVTAHQLAQLHFSNLHMFN
ncbi:MAG: hypothetical protein ACSHYA_19180 [Opitutaceae bacterium]